MILLPLGSFAFGVGWLVGLILLWSSRMWTIRDKLIGTLIVPGGLATTLLFALAVLFVLGPIASAVYLARRARRSSPSGATPLP